MVRQRSPHVVRRRSSQVVRRRSPHVDLVEIFKNHAINHAFFYVTLDPERALGLEDILPNYAIICPYKSRLTEKLKREGVEIVVLEELITEEELEKIVQRGTYGILRSEFVLDYMRKIRERVKNVYVLVLKNSQLIEDFCKKQGWRLLAPKAKIAEQFENKISQYKLLKNIVPYPNSIIGALGNYFLGNTRPPSERTRFVLQFNRGHSGNSTFFIKSPPKADQPLAEKKDLEKLYLKFPKRKAKISEHINGKTYTLNCLVLKSGEVIAGSLSEQITGLKSATSNPNTTCGNDFSAPKKLSKQQIGAIKKITKDIGETMRKKGYRGLFGIDVIIEQGSGKSYFIEINTHQPASVSFEAKIHRKIGKVPLLAYFILDSLNGEIKPAKRDLPPIVLPISARQIIYRNKTVKILRLKDAENRYGQKGLVSRMKYIKPNEEIYRIQRLNNRAIK